jgi:hypothetical protein
MVKMEDGDIMDRSDYDKKFRTKDETKRGKRG